MRFSFLSCLALGCALVASCAEDTATVGTETMPAVDHAETSQQLFYVNSRTVESGAVLEGTSQCYLGNVTDADNGSETKADFLAQYHIMENTIFPDMSNLELVDGQPSADSCFVTLYFTNYFGDPKAPMKLIIEPLSKDKVMEEGKHYYTDINPDEYVEASSPFKKTMTYTIQQAIDGKSSSATYNKISVRLSDELATQVFRKYYEDPNNFKNSYNFIRKVFPGLYFHTEESVGSMLNVEFSTFDVYFHYYETASDGKKKKVDGMQRMSATEEVLQNTRIVNNIPADMTDETNDFTYIKSPAGLFTEVTLPIDEIAFGVHYTDTINMARISFGRINETSAGSYKLSPASRIMIIQKDALKDFFDKGKVADDETSSIAEFSNDNNAYEFANISRIISTIRSERNAGAGVKKDDSDSERAAKYAVWDAAHPDWNKFLLVPVVTEYSSSSSGSSSITNALLRVRNQLSLSSVKLAGGPSGNLSINVVYSRFK